MEQNYTWDDKGLSYSSHKTRALSLISESLWRAPNTPRESKEEQELTARGLDYKNTTFGRPFNVAHFLRLKKLINRLADFRTNGHDLVRMALLKSGHWCGDILIRGTYTWRWDWGGWIWLLPKVDSGVDLVYFRFGLVGSIRSKLLCNVKVVCYIKNSRKGRLRWKTEIN